MTSLIVFDFDGVLSESRDLHFDALNQALEEVAGSEFVISREDHLARFNGRPTVVKLKMLSEERGLSSDLHTTINAAKQTHTAKIMQETLVEDHRMFSELAALKGMGYRLACASNCSKDTLHQALHKLGLFRLFEFILSNEDVTRPKPHPEIYLRACTKALVKPSEVLIVEDSDHGREAALAAGCNLCPVDGPDTVSAQYVLSYLTSTHRTVRVLCGINRSMHVVIPMAGLGSRFSMVGYVDPKPLIRCIDRPMIQVVVENLGFDAHFIFVAQRAHVEKYNLGHILTSIVPRCTIVCVDAVTEGPACTVLVAREQINNHHPLLIANSDQFLEYDSHAFMVQASQSDGCIITFHQPDATDRKWSYVEVDDSTKLVKRIAEKDPISAHATVGVYHWSRGDDFVRQAESMIAKNERVNGEFYVGPCYNEAIAEHKRITVHQCKKMHGLGVPADLAKFEKEFIQHPKWVARKDNASV